MDQNLSKHRSLLILHIAVILFGFTAILGNVIDLSALVMVWWRVLITIGIMYLYIMWRKGQINFSFEYWKKFLGIGIIVGLHWLCFYGSVKLANASICLITLATTSFFTSLLEPLYFKKPLNKGELLLGVAIVPSMALIAQGSGVEYYWGIIVGLLSAFFASVFSVMNKKYVDEVNVLHMTLIEMVGVFLLMSGILLGMQLLGTVEVFLPPTPMDWVYIFTLAILCTNVAWVLALIALKKLSVFEANLVVNLEPIYGIVMAAVLLKEYQQLNTNFYIGAALIIAIVIYYPYYQRKELAKK